jgi:hypothetical protein
LFAAASISPARRSPAASFTKLRLTCTNTFGNMYNAHRGMVPQGGPNTRLNELLDQIRAEFDQEARRSVDYENQSEFVLF